MSINRQFLLSLLFIFILSSAKSLSLRTGTIYKLQCQVTGKVFIGRTTIDIDQAIKNTIKNFNIFERNDRVFEVLANKDYNVTILEIIYELANDKDLRKRQRFYIDQYDSAVNKCIPTRTKKEYDKDNRDRFSQLSKNYYEENRESVLQRQKVNYQQNKLLQKVICEVCGGTYTTASLAKHNKTKRHLTALAKLNTGPESGPQYEQQLSELLNDITVTCNVCGGDYIKGSLWNHKQTKRHLTALAKLNSGSESGPQYEQQLNELISAQEVTCEVCGGKFAKMSLWYHNRSKRHIRALAKLTNQGTSL